MARRRKTKFGNSENYMNKLLGKEHHDVTTAAKHSANAAVKETALDHYNTETQSLLSMYHIDLQNAADAHREAISMCDSNLQEARKSKTYDPEQASKDHTACTTNAEIAYKKAKEIAEKTSDDFFDALELQVDNTLAHVFTFNATVNATGE